MHLTGGTLWCSKGMAGRKPGSGHGWFLAQVERECVRVTPHLSAFCLGLNPLAPFYNLGLKSRPDSSPLSSPPSCSSYSHMSSEVAVWGSAIQSSDCAGDEKAKPRAPEVLTRITQTVRGQDQALVMEPRCSTAPKGPRCREQAVYVSVSTGGRSRSVTRSPSQRTSRKT